jgi:hypothetical protein
MLQKAERESPMIHPGDEAQFFVGNMTQGLKD